MQTGSLIKHKITGRLAYIKRMRPGVNRIQVKSAYNGKTSYWRMSVVEQHFINPVEVNIQEIPASLSMTTQQKEVYELYLQGKTSKEIADILNVPASSVRGRLSEVKRKVAMMQSGSVAS